MFFPTQRYIWFSLSKQGQDIKSETCMLHHCRYVFGLNQTRLCGIVYNALILSGLDFHIIPIVLDAKIWGGAVGVHPETKAHRSISCLEQIFYRAQVLILLWAALVEHQPHFIPMLFCTLWVCISLIKCYLFYIYLLKVIFSVYPDSVLKCHL